MIRRLPVELKWIPSMKLYWLRHVALLARKCLVSAHELGLREKIELLPAAPHPVNRDRALVASNPLGKVPHARYRRRCRALRQSRDSCEYLNAAGRWTFDTESCRRRDGQSYRDEALVTDGILDAAVLVRYETFARPESLRWKDWIDWSNGQSDLQLGRTRTTRQRSRPAD